MNRSFFFKEKGKTLLSLVCVLGALNFISCNSDDMDAANADKQQKQDGEHYTMSVTYKGITYEVPCIAYDDSIEFLNEEFKNLYENEISDLPKLIVYVEENGDIVYYSSEEDMMKDRSTYILDIDDNSNVFLSKSDDPQEVMLRNVSTTTLAGRAILFDDVGYKDRSIIIDTDYIFTGTKIAKLKNYGKFNDKTSSLQLYSYIPNNQYLYVNWRLHCSTNELQLVFIGYEDSYYKSTELVYKIPNGGSIIKENLKKVPCRGSKNWNDRISSVKLYVEGVTNVI